MSFDPLSILRRLQELDETVDIEAKTGSAAGEAVMKTVSAFSNEPGRGGGYILWGVTKSANEEEQRYEVHGVSDPDMLTNDVVSQCTGMMSEPVRPTIESCMEPTTGKVLVAAFVPEAADHQKPVYVKKLGLPKGAFRRISGHDVQCSHEDLQELFRRPGTTTYDESIAEGATFDDLDPDAFDAYRKMRSDREAPELELSNLDLARAIAAVKQTGDSYTPTVAGVILFGRRMALRRLFPMLRIEYIRVSSTVWPGDPEAGFDALEILDGLLLSVPRIYQSVVGDIPRSFKLSNGSVVRDEAPLIPAGAIREAIVNAVMHRSYQTRQPTQVIRFSDRIEIRNPGTSLVPDDKLGEPGSKTRNEKIAAVLHDTKLAENKGLGIPTMRNLVVNAGLLPPSFRSDRDRDEFVASFGMQHFLDTDDLDWLTKFKGYALGDDQAKALVYVRKNGVISNAEYRALNHVDTLVASRRLRALTQAGLVVPQGAGTGRKYLPGPQFLRPQTATRQAPQKRSPRLDRDGLLSGLPEDIRASIAALPKPTSGRQLDDLVLRVLAVNALSGSQLGTLMNRTAAAVQRSLTRLQAQGLVARTQPKWHPFQSYAPVIAVKDIDQAAEQGTLIDLFQ